MQQIRDHLLAVFQLRQIAQRLQNPRAQFAPAHRRDCAIEHCEQAGVPHAARFNQLEVGLRGGVEHNVMRRRIAAQCGEMIDVSPKLVLQVMNDGTGGGDGRRHLRAAETVE